MMPISAASLTKNAVGVFAHGKLRNRNFGHGRIQSSCLSEAAAGYATIIRQRSFPLTTAAGHGDPLRVRAPQRGGKALGWPTSITEHRCRAEEAVVVDLLDEEICDISAGYEA